MRRRRSRAGHQPRPPCLALKRPLNPSLIIRALPVPPARNRQDSRQCQDWSVPQLARPCPNRPSDQARGVIESVADLGGNRCCVHRLRRTSNLFLAPKCARRLFCDWARLASCPPLSLQLGRHRLARNRIRLGYHRNATCTRRGCAPSATGGESLSSPASCCSKVGTWLRQPFVHQRGPPPDSTWRAVNATTTSCAWECGAQCLPRLGGRWASAWRDAS